MSELMRWFLILLSLFMISLGARQIALAVTTGTVMDLALGPDSMTLDRIKRSEQPIRFVIELLASVIITVLGLIIALMFSFSDF